jgi:hypothetical protein
MIDLKKIPRRSDYENLPRCSGMTKKGEHCRKRQMGRQALEKHGMLAQAGLCYTCAYAALHGRDAFAKRGNAASAKAKIARRLAREAAEDAELLGKADEPVVEVEFNPVAPQLATPPEPEAPPSVGLYAALQAGDDLVTRKVMLARWVARHPYP